MANPAAGSSSIAEQGYQFEGDEEELVYGAASGWVEARTWCDHLASLSSDLVHIPTPDTPCNRCEHPSENWLCLCCKEVLCSRFVNKHMLQHYQQTSHSLALSYSDLSAWCFACDSYLDAQLISQLQPVHETAYILKFDIFGMDIWNWCVLVIDPLIFYILLDDDLMSLLSGGKIISNLHPFAGLW